MFTATSALTAFGQASDSDRYLEALAATQSFSLGRPIQAMPTADGKAADFSASCFLSATVQPVCIDLMSPPARPNH